ncbi:MAG: phage holin family protein [Candidatus Absconditabacterales bacterium]
MKILKQFIVNIVINSVILYLVVKYVPELGFIVKSEYKDIFVVFGILGFIFWLFNSVLKKILKILTLPIKFLTLGLFSLLLNLVIFYIFGRSVNYLDIGITLQLGTLLQTFILSLVITFVYFLIKKII